MLKTADLYAATNNGLDIIRLYFPEADPGKAFKMRDESTPSARVKLYGSVYKTTDFGDDAQALSPLDIVMREEKMTFAEALYYMAGKFNLAPEINPTVNLPGIKQRDPLPDEKDDQFEYELNEEFTEAELKLMGPNVTNEHCKKLNYYSVKWYSKVKAASKKDGNEKPRRVTIMSSNENYPIIMRQCGEFQKFYQPLNPKKEFRFFYNGSKPREYINGLAELKKAYQDYNEAQEAKYRQSHPEEDENSNSYKPVKYPEAVICSGERDALNVCSFGSMPLWFNSETYNLSDKEYKEISHYAEKIFNIPDIDTTGKRKAAELALKYIDIHTAWLPEDIKKFLDSRRRPRKDLRDFVELRPDISNYKNLLNTAYPARFWEYKITQWGPRLELNTEYLIHFLSLNGFYKMPFIASKAGQILVHVKDNIVNEVNTTQIRDFVKRWLRDRYYPVDILNLVNNSKRIADSGLEGLQEITLDFDDFEAGFQYLFFQNKAVKITADEIKETAYRDVPKNVWQPLVIKNDFKRTQPAFKTTWNEEKRSYDIEILNKQSKFFRFLINASRIHWRKELETSLEALSPEEQVAYCEANKFEIAGPNLNAIDQEEQRLHLLNKIFSIGYLLHSWKARHRAWCVFAMDNRISEEGCSNGRSGKSFCYGTLEKFKVAAYLSGRNEKLQENKHMFEEVSELTRLMIINDAHKYFPMSLFFDIVTEKLPVNPKFGKQFTLPFEKAPKMVISTNFASRNLDDSTQARLLYTVFSDYYHEQTDNNDFRETRKIYDDFNKQLQSEDYTGAEWNDDFNFYADCVSFYISTVATNRVVRPPMDNVMKRNLREGIGDAFKDWADRYFLPSNGDENPDGVNVNTELIRSEVMEDYLKTNRRDTPQNFSKKLEMWCKYTAWIKQMNPKHLHNTKDGRILRKIDGKTHEMLFIQSIDKATILDYSQVSEPLDNENLPF